MKNSAISILILLSTASALAQSAIDDIAVALKTGSSKELVKHFNDVTELKIEGKEANYSKAQAESVVKDFFRKHPAKTFAYIHKGSSPGGLKYSIGIYTYDKGSFRVVMYLKPIGDKYVIDSISFSKE